MDESESKYKQWQELMSLVDRIRDETGLAVDPGIKEVVTSLLALGFPTGGSCAGHLDHGVKAPWIDIGRNLPKQYFKLFAKIGLPHKPGKPPNADDIFATYTELRSLRNTNLRLQAQLRCLLHAFYYTHQPRKDAHLVLNEIGCYGVVRLISHGAHHQAERTAQQRKVRLRPYQREMHAFGAFLKTHYFAAAESNTAGAHQYETGHSR